MSVIHVKQLCELPENGCEHDPAPAFGLQIEIDNQPIPDYRLMTSGFTSLIIPNGSNIQLSGQSGKCYWVNGILCEYNDKLINSLNKPIEVHIFQIENTQPQSSIFPLTS